jgi:RNA polymerase sigma-70 factor (ECF subfamily)
VTLHGETEDGSFPTTRWSLVQDAGADRDAPRRREAVAQLLRRYAPVLQTHLVRARNVRPDQADDVVQSFLADKVLAGDLISRAEQGRGRFRTFLVASLDHYFFSYVRAERAQKRGGAARVTLDEGLYVADHCPGPDRSFDVSWARQVLAQAIDAMRAECTATGRTVVWGVFEGRVLSPVLHGGQQVSYGELVRRYGFVSPSQASNVLVTATRMFARELRKVVGAYASSDEEIDEEIADLRRILASSP